MEMPIFESTFRSPLPIALTTRCSASSGPMPSGRRPARWSEYSDSNRMYGFTAEAPKPIRQAMWWISRASPVSATSPILRRVPSRTRW